MIRLAALAARAELRRAPGRCAAVAVLLGVAVLLHPLLRPGSFAGLALAVVVAAAATAGALEAEGRRTRILAENGAGPAGLAVVTAATLVAPGLAAAATATLVGLVSGGVRPLTALGLAVAVPVLTASVTAALVAVGGTRSPGVTGALVVLACLTAPLLVGPLAVLALVVHPRVRLGPGALRITATVLAVGVTGTVAWALSRAESFFDLWLLMVVTAGPLAVAVGWLGTAAVSGLARAVAHLGPTARLAATPLAHRRHLLGPVAAVVAVVATLAAAQGVVGASFGAREEARRAVPRTVLGVAGTDDDEVIAVTTGLTPADLLTRVADATAAAPDAEVALVDRVGGGGTDASPGDDDHDDDEPGGFLDLANLRSSPPDVTVPTGGGPRWVGVVDPSALGALGLADHAAALARGDALVLNPATEVVDGTVAVSGPDRTVAVPAVGVSERTGLLLPAVLVSDVRAVDLGGERTGARVVVRAPAVADALRVADDVAAGSGDPVLATGGGSGAAANGWFAASFERDAPAVTGGEVIRTDPTDPLDGVPWLARSAAQGGPRVVTFAALALLVALAGTLLVTGGTRAEDAVLVVQGAPTSFRVAAAAVQTGVVAAAGAALGAVVGVGVPAVAIGLYNGRGRSAEILDVPVVVPARVGVVLALVPVVAAAAAALVVGLRRPPSTRLLADAALG